MTTAAKIVLYRRSDCAACDRAVEAVTSIASVSGLAWLERSVDGDERLEQRYGSRVPVIVLEQHGAAIELAATHVNPAALARDLRAALSPEPRSD